MDPTAPEGFDHDRVYYRVVGDNDRYIYRDDDEPEIMTSGQGLVVAPR